MSEISKQYGSLKPAQIFGQIGPEGVYVSTDFSHEIDIFRNYQQRIIDLKPVIEAISSSSSFINSEYSIKYSNFMFCSGNISQRIELFKQIAAEIKPEERTFLIGSFDIIDKISDLSILFPIKISVDWKVSNLLFALNICEYRPKSPEEAESSRPLSQAEIGAFHEAAVVICGHLSQHLISQGAYTPKPRKIGAKNLDPSDEKSNIESKSKSFTGFEIAQEVFENRKLRNDYITHKLFAGTAWDILVFLMINYNQKEGITITKLCEETDVPITTALRWISELVDMGLINRSPDKKDGRKVFLKLSQSAMFLINKYFLEISNRSTHTL